MISFYHRCSEAGIEEFKVNELDKLSQDQWLDMEEKLPTVDMRDANPEEMRAYHSVTSQLKALLSQKDTNQEAHQEPLAHPEPVTFTLGSIGKKIVEKVKSFAQSATDAIHIPIVRDIVTDQAALAKDLILLLAQLKEYDDLIQDHNKHLGVLGQLISNAHSFSDWELVQYNTENFVAFLRDRVQEVTENAHNQARRIELIEGGFQNQNSPRLFQPARSSSSSSSSCELEQPVPPSPRAGTPRH